MKAIIVAADDVVPSLGTIRWNGTSISQRIENRKNGSHVVTIGDKLLVDMKIALVVPYDTLKQGGEGVVDVAPMMNFHLSFLFNQLF